MKWTKENIEKANEEYRKLPTTVKDEDILAEANKQLNTEFTNIRIGYTEGDFDTKEDYIHNNPYFLSDAKITLKTCPHCNKWFPSSINICSKRRVTECTPTYSKELKRFYSFELIMCPKCRKDYALVHFKDDRFERNGRKTNEYREAVIFNPNEESYPDELLAL